MGDSGRRHNLQGKRFCKKTMQGWRQELPNHRSVLRQRQRRSEQQLAGEVTLKMQMSSGALLAMLALVGGPAEASSLAPEINANATSMIIRVQGSAGGQIGRRSKTISGGAKPQRNKTKRTKARTRKTSASPSTSGSAFRVPSGRFNTTHGPMVFRCSAGGSCTASYRGTLDNQPAKIVGKISRSGQFRGYWAEVDSAQKCSSKKFGTFYWGRWHARFSRQRTSYVGTWGYCNASPSSGLSGQK